MSSGKFFFFLVDICPVIDILLTMKKTRQYAFWKYDLFPFVLGGEVSRHCVLNGKEMVETINFGKGNWFVPIKVLDLEVGLKVQAKLDDLTNRRKEFLKVAEKMFDLELNAINAGFI